MTQPVTLVTGTSKGIGKATAERLAVDGHLVIGIARTTPSDAPGPFYSVDLIDRVATAQVLAEITSAYDIDNLVNNAGYSSPQTLEDTDFETFDSVIAVNLGATLQCTQACLPSMKAKGKGRIVNISSRAVLGKEERTAYAAAKAGTIGYTRTWALELAEYGITVNAVAPGPVATALFKRNHPEGSDKLTAVMRNVPLQRGGEPEEIAGPISFLLSDDASDMTGQVLYVCGGMSVGNGAV